MSNGPLIVQSDKTLLLEVDHPDATACRMAIAPFAELERSPEHVHTYRLTPLGLWNARAAGHDAEQVIDALLTYSRFPVPHALLVDVASMAQAQATTLILVTSTVAARQWKDELLRRTSLTEEEIGEYSGARK